MKFCPKCRSFYSDAELRFCIKDGVPLIAVSDGESLRREGEDFIQRTERRIERETFRKRVRKIVSIVITAILMILIISVLTINSWLFFNPEKVETAKNEPQPSIQVPAEPEPSVEVPAEIVPANAEPSPEITGTPPSEPTPIPEISPPPPPPPRTEVINTPSTPPPTETPPTEMPPTEMPPPTPVPVITPTPMPVRPPTVVSIPPGESCREEERTQAISFIKKKYGKVWRKEILKQKEPLKNEIAAANDLSSDQFSVKLNYSTEQISVFISPDCQKAAIRIQVLWTVQPNEPNVKIRVVPPRRSTELPYRCEKTGSLWSCN